MAGLDLEKIYEKAKLHLWIPFFLPLGILVLVEYARALLWFAQIGVIVYIFLQFVGVLVGFWVGLLKRLSSTNRLLDLTEYKIMRVVPTIGLGVIMANKILEKTSPDPEDQTLCPQPSSHSSTDFASESD